MQHFHNACRSGPSGTIQTQPAARSNRLKRPAAASKQRRANVVRAAAYRRRAVGRRTSSTRGRRGRSATRLAGERLGDFVVDVLIKGEWQELPLGATIESAVGMNTPPAQLFLRPGPSSWCRCRPLWASSAHSYAVSNRSIGCDRVGQPCNGWRLSDRRRRRLNEKLLRATSEPRLASGASSPRRRWPRHPSVFDRYTHR